ncbi:hypothetical protein [Niameybacter sp.]|uniref:hypothetical protein n=1 Tax=Niameybacter sp. TaxID=2033640 RepID=UPI002FC59A25
MPKIPALHALIEANCFAFKSNKVTYLARAFTEIASVAAIFLAMKSTEYTTNSAYHLFEGTTSFSTVVVGVSGFTLSLLLFQLIGILSSLLPHLSNLTLKTLLTPTHKHKHKA